GTYSFNLVAEDITGKTTSVTFNATIQSSTKLGNYSLNFTDLQTKVGNVPITITRTYNSQHANDNGDFGYGWTLGMKKGGLHVDLPTTGDPLLGDLGWQAAYQNGTRIELTLPDGSTRGFTTVVIPDTGGYNGSGSLLGLANLYLVAFMPDVDSRDTSLQIETGQVSPLNVDPSSGLPVNLGLPEALTDQGFQSTVVYYDPDTNELRDPTGGGGLPFNPATYGWKFRVEQVDGTVYEFDSGTGQLLDQTDRLGNRINYSNDGDTLEARDNTGKLLSTVQINRTNGRIDTIQAIWNDGTNTLTKTLQYTYNGMGDLETFTDFNNTVTQYTYNHRYTQNPDKTWQDGGDLHRPHFLTRITDVATGINTLTATFDGDGRLSGLVDASGASAGISYILDDNTVTLPSGQTPQITVDALDNHSGVIRDANGNIVRQFQQTGTNTYLVTVYQYDTNNNQAAASKPHEVTGSERYTWQPGADDWATQTQYGDPNNPGLPTVVTDANHNTTTYTYDGHGNIKSVVDPLGQTTTNVYDDSNGQLKQSSDGTGATSTYTYDPRGNLQSVQQTDDNGKLVSVVTPHFNALDLMDSFQNAANQTVSVGYDTRGRQTSTQYTSSDGTLIRDETDLDDQDRIKATRHYVNGTLVSSMSMIYDTLGRVMTSTDPFGNVTTTRYDIRGDIVESRTPRKDENGNAVTIVVRRAYDLDGREIAQTDPLIEGVTPTADLRVTHTIYDAAGRVVETRRLAGVGIDVTPKPGMDGIYQSSFSYNAATDTYGGVPATSVMVSSEKTHYDDQGRVDYMTSDTQLVTHYAYDANGQQIKTWYDIDLHGDGNTEHVETDTTYDAAGQQIRVVDPAGRVTDFKYNAAGQVTDTIQYGVVAAGVTPGGPGDNTSDDMVTRTIYDDLGRQVATIDALSRQTDYEYDGAGRLIAVTLPAIGNGDARRPRYEYHYDTFGHKTSVVSNIYLDPATNQIVYVTKDANGNATLTPRAADDAWLTNKGDVTAYAYDGQGRQLTRTLPGSEIEKTFYDTSAGPANGEVKYTIDFAGRVTAYDYDNTPTGAGRVVAVRYYNTLAGYTADTTGTAAVRTVRSTYDAFGRVLVVTDSAFATPTTYKYDADGRMTKIDSAQGTLHYAYDPLGRKTATWTGSGETLLDALTSATTLTQYGYDQLNRLMSTKA
ncbi:MAG: hypothetical protein JWL97_3944, partial [Gemmatimonadales bacterium]|nr:hypothetical protein [Gemmatimonadales bacterium]